MKNNLPAKIPQGINTWALQLERTDQIAWERGEEFDTLQFKWEEVSIASRSTVMSISNAVARAHPDFTDKQVKDMAISIKNVKDMKRGDYVLGVEGESLIEKVGYINEIGGELRQAAIQIRWNKEIPESRTSRPLFDQNKVVQKVKGKMWEEIYFDIERLVGFVPAHLHENFYQESYEYIVKEPTKLYFGVPKKEQGGKITLFYGTNRNKTGSANFNEYYGGQVEKLQFGLCEVNIPKGHVQGELERPKIWKLQFKENPNRDVVISDLRELEENDFMSQLSQGLDGLPRKAALVFIHGYNVSFAEAARRAGQIAWDIPFQGLPGFFSWPSAGKVIDYLADIEKADASVLPLQAFIEKMIEQTGVEELHLIAHSMGNRVLTATLKNLSQTTLLLPKLHCIKQIVLGAADIDQQVFMDNILPAFKTIGERRTIYSSDSDRALIVSKGIRHGLTRLGDAGPKLFVAEGVDTVDASNVPSEGNGHGYIFDTKELLTDLFYLLGKGLPPSDRRLKAREKDGLKYWLFLE